MLNFIMFVTGLVVGSFLNVVIDRNGKKDSIMLSRSKCESCKRQLSWFDLIPLVSFVVLRGKCRFCKKKIPKRLFVVEALTGTGFAVLSYFFLPGNFLVFLFFASVFSLLLVIFFIDAIQGIIPDKALAGIIVITLLYYIMSFQSGIIHALLTAIFMFLFFLVLFIVTKGRGIGFGDVKFLFVIGFLLSYPGSIFAVYVAFLTGAFVSIILILKGRKKFKKDSIAFGPFLVIGIFMFYIFQDRVLEAMHAFLP